MSQNSCGLLVSKTKDLINAILGDENEFLISHFEDTTERTLWRASIHFKYSLIVNLYLYAGTPFLNISFGLSEIPRDKKQTVALDALARNEYLGIMGRYGIDDSILSFSFQMPLEVIDKSYIQFVLQRSGTIAEDVLKSFREDYEMVPLVEEYRNKSLAS